MVPKSFSFARFIYPREARDQVAISNWGRLGFSCCHICGCRAATASGGQFDEPMESVCEMPQVGHRKIGVLICFFYNLWILKCLINEKIKSV